MKVEIKPYLEENNPKGLLEKLGVTLEAVLSNKGDFRSTCTPKLPLLDEPTSCIGVMCSECPFHTTMETAVTWLSQK